VSSLFDGLPQPVEVNKAPDIAELPPALPNEAPTQRAMDNDLGNRARQQIATKVESRNGGYANSLNFDLTPFGDDLTFADAAGQSATPGSSSACSTVGLSSLTPRWLAADGEEPRLVAVRNAEAGDRKVIQGILLDWQRLRAILLDEVRDIFPDARLLPVTADASGDPARMMTALPVLLDPGPWASAWRPEWTPLRTGLVLAWAAALAALLMVGLGGWSLLDLSERRFRFVSAVTHELRTPLTTLRLYLDMLTSGFVRDEAKKTEYLHTLHGEADRLHRLIGNVLDYARLERQRPRPERTSVAVGELLDGVRATWDDRCRSAGKELTVQVQPGTASFLTTDAELMGQVLGILIDNACKYSQGATDRHVWLRARPDGASQLALEVEDRGPGVAACERRGIFRPFRRGRQADETAGGIGLGLALAERWARLLGGRLSVTPGTAGVGACFRLRLPLG
jgi:signal transduction histidine kinase